MALTMVGYVKWFNDEKGYGFIDIGDDDEDVFVHYTAIVEEGYRSLKQGEKVRFELYEGERGPQARNVVKVADGENHCGATTS